MAENAFSDRFFTFCRDDSAPHQLRRGNSVPLQLRRSDAVAWQNDCRVTRAAQRDSQRETRDHHRWRRPSA